MSEILKKIICEKALISSDGYEQWKRIGNTCLTIKEAESIALEAARVQSIAFAKWMYENIYREIYSQKLDRHAFVSAKKHEVFIHGSDYHYTHLIEEHGKALEEVYQEYLSVLEKLK